MTELDAGQYSDKIRPFYFRSEALVVRIMSTTWRYVCFTGETSAENNIEPRTHDATLLIHS
jgi:hypothetical protein